MKIKVILVSIASLFIVATVSTVYATNHLPTVSTACETKSGYLYAFDDGFSRKTKCKGNSRRIVLLGEKGEQGEKGEKGDKGDPGPTASASAKAIKVFDANGTELGIYENRTKFFYPTLQRFVQLDSSGSLEDNGRGFLYYLTSNCTGTAYIQVDNEEGDMTDCASRLYSNKDGIYYILEIGASSATSPLLSRLPDAIAVCESYSGNNQPPILKELTEVIYTLPNPVPFPLEFRFE